MAAHFDVAVISDRAFGYAQVMHLAPLMHDELIINMDERRLVSVFQVARDHWGWQKETVKEVERCWRPISSFGQHRLSHAELVARYPGLFQACSLAGTTPGLAPLEGPSGYWHSITDALETARHGGFSWHLAPHEAAVLMKAGRLLDGQKAYADLYRLVIHQRIPDVTTLDFNEVVELRKAPHCVAFRRKMQVLADKADASGHIWHSQAVESLLATATASLLPKLLRSPSRATIKAIATNIPTGLIPNPASVALAIQDICQAKRIERDYGWLLFLNSLGDRYDPDFVANRVTGKLHRVSCHHCLGIRHRIYTGSSKTPW